MNNNYTSRRSRTRNTVKLTVCVCMCVYSVVTAQRLHAPKTNSLYRPPILLSSIYDYTTCKLTVCLMTRLFQHKIKGKVRLAPTLKRPKQDNVSIGYLRNLMAKKQVAGVIQNFEVGGK